MLREQARKRNSDVRYGDDVCHSFKLCVIKTDREMAEPPLFKYAAAAALLPLLSLHIHHGQKAVTA